MHLVDVAHDVGKPSGSLTLCCWRFDSSFEELLKWRREGTASQGHELAGRIHGHKIQRPGAEDVGPGTDLASARSLMDLGSGTHGRSGRVRKRGRAPILTGSQVRSYDGLNLLAYERLLRQPTVETTCTTWVGENIVNLTRQA